MADACLEPLFALMAEANASDLHWCEGDTPRLRVNGFLRAAEVPESLRALPFAELTAKLIGRGNLDVLMRDREFDASASVLGGKRIRINCFFKRDRLSWAIRLLPDRFLSFEELGLPLPFLRNIIEMRQGLVLVTGATGSGKTTTLASILNQINLRRHEHILTIEDPVEYVHESAGCLVSQREVGHDTLGFHNALRAALREDPDIVLLGEMRDRESMDAALTLAETGHLTFATLHTSGAVETITRVISAFEAIEQAQTRERLAANLKVVLTQRLVPWANHAGRSLCAEIMVSTPAVRALIRDGKERQLLSLIETGAAHGMTTMTASLAQLVQRSIVSPEEALRHAPDREALLRVL